MELDVNVGSIYSNDNMDDLLLLTPTSSKLNNKSYINSQINKENPMNELTDLRKSIKKTDKYIKNSSSNLTSNKRVSPFNVKERHHANSHQTNN